jgi:hypothetical protein
MQCERMKKFLNYLGEGVPGAFLHQIRRTETAADFHRICREFLDHDRPMTMNPQAGEAGWAGEAGKNLPALPA